MFRIWIICFSIVAPLSIIPFVLKPVLGIVVIAIGTLVFRTYLGWGLYSFFERFYERDTVFEKDGYRQALEVTRNLALQYTEADLEIWVSNQTDLKVQVLRDRIGRRAVVFGKTFLDRLSEAEVRKEIVLANRLTRHSKMCEYSELIRFRNLLRQSRRTDRNPFQFIVHAVFGLYRNEIELCLSKTMRIIGLLTPASTPDAELAL